MQTFRTTADMRSGKQTTRCASNRCTSCRTEWQNRMADRCKQMQMNAQPDCQIARTCRRTDAQLAAEQDNQIARCIARCIARRASRQAEQQAGRPAEQMDIQIDRCIARYADGHAEQMHGQQKLNPIEDFTGPARNVPNAVSAKNPWHRWTSIGNVDRYQADEPAERLRNAWKTPKKRWKRSSVLFCLFWCAQGTSTLGAGWDVMGWLCLPHGFATCACW